MQQVHESEDQAHQRRQSQPSRETKPSIGSFFFVSREIRIHPFFGLLLCLATSQFSSFNGHRLTRNVPFFRLGFSHSRKRFTKRHSKLFRKNSLDFILFCRKTSPDFVSIFHPLCKITSHFLQLFRRFTSILDNSISILDNSFLPNLS